MNKLLHLFFCLFSFFSYGQIKDDRSDRVIVDTITYQRVCFSISDSVYKATLFRYSDGYFFFELGFKDSAIAPVEYAQFKGRKQSQEYRYVFSYISGIDTIRNCVIASGKQYSDSMSLKKIKMVNFEFSNLLDDISFSYIYRALTKGEKVQADSKHSLSFIYPDKDFGENNGFTLARIDLSAIQTSIEYRKGYSLGPMSFETVDVTHIDLKPRQRKELMKKLDLIKTIPDCYCAIPGNLFFLSVKEDQQVHNHVLSPYCIKNEKNSSPLKKGYDNVFYELGAYISHLDPKRAKAFFRN